MEAVGRSLRNMWIIAKQEFSLFFASPLVSASTMLSSKRSGSGANCASSRPVPNTSR